MFHANTVSTGKHYCEHARVIAGIDADNVNVGLALRADANNVSKKVSLLQVWGLLIASLYN
ncbi:hypothetical protein D3C79_1111880 [compost metagenome]